MQSYYTKRVEQIKEESMLGVPGTGPYSLPRSLRDQIKLDEQHLEAAPLGPRQRKKLEEHIAYQKERLKEALAKLKIYKIKKAKNLT